MGPCPSCGNWVDCDTGHCYYCGAGGGMPAPPTVPATPKMPQVPANIGTFDAHLGCWKPLPGRYLELQEFLGKEWEWCEYYYGFFSGVSSP